MELKKLHLGTMSYAVDSMDEVAHQLATAFGVSGELLAAPCSHDDWLIYVTFKRFRISHSAFKTVKSSNWGCSGYTR
jgi:hypothetical protein